MPVERTRAVVVFDSVLLCNVVDGNVTLESLQNVDDGKIFCWLLDDKYDSDCSDVSIRSFLVVRRSIVVNNVNQRLGARVIGGGVLKELTHHRTSMRNHLLVFQPQWKNQVKIHK
jgi:hypothetical protein